MSDTPLHILEQKRQQIRARMEALGFSETATAVIVAGVNPDNADEILELLAGWLDKRRTDG